jgi:predicted DsbA family dithiol-disulfide isomerase
MIQDSMRAMGISGVPFFIINDQYGLSGAVPAQQLVQAFKELEMKEN